MIQDFHFSNGNFMKNKKYISCTFILILIFITYNFSFSYNKYALNIRNEIVSLDTLKKPFFAIFVQKPCCTRCIEILYKCINKIKDEAKVVIIINSGFDAQSKRLDIIYFKSYCNFDIAYFNVIDSNKYKHLIFDEYNVIYSPSLLYVGNDKEEYFDYKDLFNNQCAPAFTLSTIKNRIAGNIVPK